MPKREPERRGSGAQDSGHRRRVTDIEGLSDRVEDLENLRLVVDGLMETIGRLDGRTGVILELVQTYLPTIEKKSGKVSFWTGVQIVGGLLVPVLIALISGYFLLKSSIPPPPPPTP